MDSVVQWRKQRDASLRVPDGWLTLVGLHWLKVGENTIGSESSGTSITFQTCDTEHIGTINLSEDGHTTFLPHEGVVVELQSDQNNAPTILQHKSLSWFVIKRGSRFGLRVKDSESEVLKNFHGMEYFDIDLSYRVEATFKPHPEPMKLKIPNAIGEYDEETSYGTLHFTLKGQECSLLSLENPKEKLWLIFRDQSTNKETYGGGRFLWTTRPVDENNTTTLDFNMAYNPPCVFTPYATCPYPPSENELPVSVLAGEKKFHD